jgi:16S rRNA processing protein RimM
LQLADQSTRPAKVVHASPHGPLWHLRIEGFESPESAATLNNALVLIPSQERLPAPKGEYYSSDLEGLTVVDDSGKVRGKVISVIELPSINSLELRINGIEVIAPWIDSCVGHIDLDARTVLIHIDFLIGVYPELEKK